MNEPWAAVLLSVYDQQTSPKGYRKLTFNMGGIPIRMLLNDDDIRKLMLALLSGNSTTMAALVSTHTQRLPLSHMQRDGKIEISLETLGLKPVDMELV